MPQQKKKQKSGKEALNIEQQRFCELYATTKEFYGNGTESYIEAYNIDTSKKGYYKSAATCAWRLLKDVDILLYINSLLESDGLNDAFVDKQLLFLITQHADLKSKLGSIKEYNQLKKRIQQRIDLTSGGEKIIGIEYIIPKEDDTNNRNQDTTETELEATPGE